MKRIHKFFAAVSVCSLMATFALAPAALAAGTASGAAAGRTVTLPNSNIKGSPAHFSPSALSAKARWDGVSSCSTSQGSFTISNHKNVAEKLTLSGTGLKPASGKVGAHKVVVVCITKGYTGTVHVTLKDGKKLTVTF